MTCILGSCNNICEFPAFKAVLPVNNAPVYKKLSNAINNKVFVLQQLIQEKKYFVNVWLRIWGTKFEEWIDGKYFKAFLFIVAQSSIVCERCKQLKPTAARKRGKTRAGIVLERNSWKRCRVIFKTWFYSKANLRITLTTIWVVDWWKSKRNLHRKCHLLIDDCTNRNWEQLKPGGKPEIHRTLIINPPTLPQAVSVIND